MREQRHLEEPAYLGRPFPTDPDAYRHYSRDRSTGSVVFLDLLMIVATLAYASEHAWFLVIPCALASVGLSIAAYRRVKKMVRDEMDADPTETLDTLVRRR